MTERKRRQVLCWRIRWHVQLRRIRERRRVNTRNGGTKAGAVDSLRCRHRRGCVRSAVVRALHDDDPAAAVVRFGYLDGVLDGFAAAVGEEEGIERRVRHEWEETLDETDVGFRVSNVDLRMNNLFQLASDGGGDGRMSVT